MNHIPLNVLIDALSALKMLRDVADDKLTGPQYTQALRSWSALNAHVSAITKNIGVEVPA